MNYMWLCLQGGDPVPILGLWNQSMASEVKTQLSPSKRTESNFQAAKNGLRKFGR